MTFRFHLLGVPNAPSTSSFSLDGFSQASLRFSKLLKRLGHIVFFYGPEGSAVECDEFIPCVSDSSRQRFLKGCEYQYATEGNSSALWECFNTNAAIAISRRKQPRDFICLIGGYSQKSVTEAHPDLMPVEYSIGYSGSYAPYRVYESQTWRHHTAGAQGAQDGRFFDTVIPLFFDETEFKFAAVKENFALYVGRLTAKKGIGIACEAASAAGITLKVIGHGDIKLVTHEAKYLGALGDVERNEYLSRASVLLCPTQYIEPFGSVSIEAQLCGTPVVSTDFGGFTETVEQGKTGFRCNYLGEFVRGIRAAPFLDPAYIRDRAVRNYSIEAAAGQYQCYFERLWNLWGDGWNSLD